MKKLQTAANSGLPEAFTYVVLVLVILVVGCLMASGYSSMPASEKVMPRSVAKYYDCLQEKRESQQYGNSRSSRSTVKPRTYKTKKSRTFGQREIVCPKPRDLAKYRAQTAEPASTGAINFTHGLWVARWFVLGLATITLVLGLLIVVLRRRVMQVLASGNAQVQEEVDDANSRIKLEEFYPESIKMTATSNSTAPPPKLFRMLDRRKVSADPTVTVVIWPLSDATVESMTLSLLRSQCRWRQSEGLALVQFPEASYGADSGRLRLGGALLLSSSVNTYDLPVFQEPEPEEYPAQAGPPSLLATRMPVLLRYIGAGL